MGKALSDQIPECEANTEISNDDENAMRELEAAQADKTKQFKASQHDCELLEDEIRDLEEQILEAGGSKLRQQKNLVDKLKTKEKKLTSHATKFEQFETNMNEFRGEYDQIKIKKKDLEEKAVELMEVLDKKKELLSEKDSEFQKLCKIVEKSKSSLSKLTKQIF